MSPHPLRRTAAILLGLALLAVAGTLPGAASTAPPTGPIRVMALGDSITGSPGCWRALVHRDLVEDGHSIDMVGTLPGDGCGFEYDGDHEGHAGALVTDVAASGESAAWFAATRPQVVLLQFAANDIWSGRSTADILAAYTVLLEQLRAVDPTVVVVAGYVLPVAPPGCDACPGRTQELNEALGRWSNEIGTAQSPVILHDLATGWDPQRDTDDGVHPNAVGTERLAAGWGAAVRRALPLAGGYRGPTPVPSGPGLPDTWTPPASPSPAPSTVTPTPVQDSLGCTATYTVTSAWPGGFVANVRVANSGTFSVRGWTVTVDLAAGQVTNAWSATATGASPTTFDHAAWNGTLGTRGTTEFGFVGTGDPTPGTVSCRAR